MNNIIKRAKAIRSKIEEMAQGLPETEALDYVEMFPDWKPEGVYTNGEKVKYKGVLYKVIQTHDAQSTWEPDISASLFAPVLAGQEGTEIGEWVQPDSTNPYMQGDRVTYHGAVYVSTINNNVWSPDSYGWELVD